MSKKARMVIFGGSGRLGKELLSLDSSIIAPLHREIDVTETRRVLEFLSDIAPQCVIHAAAVVGWREAERDKDYAYRVNVDGTINIAKACQNVDARLVYISSVAVFDGETGSYTEEDIPCPVYYYGWIKLLGEQAARMVPDYTVIRTDFFTPGQLKYPRAFDDHYCSKLPVEEAARRVWRIARSSYQGLINIGGERDTLFNILRPFFPEVVGVHIKDSGLPSFPRDLSLDISRWKKYFEA